MDERTSIGTVLGLLFAIFAITVCVLAIGAELVLAVKMVLLHL